MQNIPVSPKKQQKHPEPIPLFQEKITLTEMRRYLPIPPPILQKQTFPIQINRFLASSKFANMSLIDQRVMVNNFRIAYRHYFPLNNVVQHLTKYTKNKYTERSIKQAVTNAAMKYEIIDWYKLIRIVYNKNNKKVQNFQKNLLGVDLVSKLVEQELAVNKIIKKYREYVKKKKIFSSITDVNDIKKLLQPRLLEEFGKQVYDEVKDYTERNRAETQNAISTLKMKDINFIQLQYFLNQSLNLVLDRKKISYLYLKFDPKNIGKFKVAKLVQSLQIVKKDNKIKVQKQYLTNIEQILGSIRQNMRIFFFSAHDMECQFDQFLQNIDSEDKFCFENLYNFINSKCEGIYSRHHIQKVFNTIGFRQNLHSLFNKPSLKDIEKVFLELFKAKEKKKIKMKVENPVFYNFRQIILLLLTKSKSKKIKKEDFSAFISGEDPKLPYHSFYCVWRVYGSLINLQRMKAQLGLSYFSCILRLKKTQEQIQKSYESLLNEYEEGTKITYGKIEEKINFSLNFILDTLNIRALPEYKDYDLVPYHKIINQLFEPQFQKKIRSYIFCKVAGKAAGLWKARKFKQRFIFQKLKNLKLSQLIIPPKKVLTRQKSNQTTKRLTSNQSNVSLRTKLDRQMKLINPQILQIIRWNIQKILNQLPLVQKSKSQKLNRESKNKNIVILHEVENYSYRTLIPKICNNLVSGAIGIAQEVVFMKDNLIKRIQLKIPYRPGLEILDFQIINNNFLLMTSYFNIEVYNLNQQSNYPQSTLQICSEFYANNSILEKICKDRIFGAFPKLLKSIQGKQYLANTAIANNKVVIIQDDRILYEVKITQGQHQLCSEVFRVTEIIQKYSINQRLNIVGQLIKLVMAEQENFSKFCILINNENLKQKFSLFNYQSIKKCCQGLPIHKLSCIFKQLTGIYKMQKLKIPNSLKIVSESLMSHMKQNNMSIWDLFQQINSTDKNILLLKNLKDYLLKMTQQVYIVNQVEIDAYLKKIAVEKQVPYDAMINLMHDWNYPLWERPYTIVQSCVYAKDFTLLIYTLETKNNIFIKNAKDSELIGIFQGHNSTPTICFVPERCLIISGDTHRYFDASIKVWRLYDDLIIKFDQKPPWRIQPIITLRAAHVSSITSINYLPRAHLIVSTSLDSTLKLWKIQTKTTKSSPVDILVSQLINVENSEQQCNVVHSLVEQKKIYSSNHYMLHSNTIILNKNNYNIEVLVLGKISKQINQNNRYKYQFNVEVYHVENMILKVGQKSCYEPIPVKMERNLIKHCQLLSNKKNIIINSEAVRQQQNMKKVLLIRKNIESYLYSAIKRYYIYSNIKPLLLVIKYLAKMQEGEKIIQYIIQSSGLKIIQQSLIEDELPQLPATKPQEIMNNNQSEIKKLSFQVPLTIKQEIMKKINKNNTTTIQIQNLKSILAPYLFPQLIQLFIQTLKKNHNTQKNHIHFKISEIQNLIQSYSEQSQISQFYYYLRQIQTKITEKGFRIWSLFVNEKKQLLKIKKVSVKQFQARLQQIGLNLSIRSFVISYLSRDNYVNFEDLVYYLRLAWQEVDISVNLQNFSEVVINNSKLLESRLLINQNLFRKSHLNQKFNQSGIRMSESRSISKEKKNISSSSKLVSQSSHPKLASDKLNNGSKSDGLKSRLISSSNSMVSFGKSHTMDSFTRNVSDIVRRFKQLLKNQGKSIWDLISLTVVDFLENDFIAESQYYSMFRIIDSPFKLKEKMNLMTYICRQSQGHIDLNLLFQLSELGEKGKIPGQKHVISFIIRRISEYNLSISQALQTYVFEEKEEASMEQFLVAISKQPFNMRHFGIKQIQAILIGQNKKNFTNEELEQLLKKLSYKHNISIQTKKITFIEEIIFKIEKRGFNIEQIFPKSQIYNFPLFLTHVQNFNSLLKEQQLISDFLMIVINSKQAKKVTIKNVATINIKYTEFIKCLNKMIEEGKKSLDQVKNNAKRLCKNLQSKRISIFSFFSALDKGRNYFLTELQFQSGLNEMNINSNLWNFINKKNPKKLFYWEFINFLIIKQAVNYKCVDSELEVAMEKFIKRFIKRQDLQFVYEKMKAKKGEYPNEVTFESFNNCLKLASLFKEQEIFYIFSAFVNSQQIKNSKLSNDEIIKDSTNTHKLFNFKMFSDVINRYRASKITTTPSYKFVEFAKKRNISLLNEFCKFLERNKKNKDVSEALKKKIYTIPKGIFVQWVQQIKAGLTEKQIKQITDPLPDPTDFNTFYSKIEVSYKKGNAGLQIQQIQQNLQSIIKLAKKQKVSIERLYKDYSKQRDKLTFNDLTEMVGFLGTGFNKIQIKQIFQSIDLEKKEYITYLQLQDALRLVNEDLQKDQQEYQLEYIIQKLTINKDKYSLKASKISFTFNRACIVFQKILSQSQTQLLYRKISTELKNIEINEKILEQYLNKKSIQIKTKKDKKYKELIMNMLKYLKRVNVEVPEAYLYFSKDSNSLSKNKFITLYQSLDPKVSIPQINALYEYLDQNKTGKILQSIWEQKLNIVVYEQEGNFTGEQLQIFYKAKMFLSELYLCFIRKMYKREQIYSYFDKYSSGLIKYEDFWNSINQLGISFDSQTERRVNNFLDKQKTKKIAVSQILHQMEESLGLKNKLILQTKTGCIFKSRIQYFAQKNHVLINRIVQLQTFLKNNDSNIFESVMLQTDFLQILNDFGVYLQQDELNDLRKNFRYNDQYLYLYPIYFMFSNLFKDIPKADSAVSQKLRFRKLFQALVKKNITFSKISKLNNFNLMNAFLGQLKIFTPIEITLIMQIITIPQTTAVDLDILKRKLLKSYLTDQRAAFGTQTGFNLRKYFRQNVVNRRNFQAIASKGHINLKQFIDILVKIDCNITRGQAESYFDLFSSDKKTVIIEELFAEQQENEEIQLELEIQSKKYEQIDLLLNHIQKSINFKGICLQQAMQKYFSVNFGEISMKSFRMFLKDIGFVLKDKQLNEIIQTFLDYYKKKYSSKLKCQALQKILNIRNHPPNFASSQNHYKIGSQSLKFLSKWIQSQQIDKQLDKWTKQAQIAILDKQKCYQFLKQLNISQNCGDDLKLFCHTLPQGNIQKSQFIDIISKLVNSRKAQSINIQNKNNKKSLANIILEKNLIKGYQSKIFNFANKLGLCLRHSGNLTRLSHLLALQYFLNKPYLLRIQPYFSLPFSEQQIQTIVIKQPITNYNIIPLNTVVEVQKDLNNYGLKLINQAFLGVNEKSSFEIFATLNTILNPDSKFFKIKGLYCWQPNSNVLASCAINLRWKYIPVVMGKLLKSILLCQQHGFCLPYLRWNQLNMETLLDKVLYPCPIDINGKIKKLQFEQLLMFEDPYCPPQFLISDIPKEKHNLSIKSNSWIFGCILYEFIFGHPPSSFTEQLREYLENRGIELDQQKSVLEQFQQKPVDFHYKFWNEKQINKLFCYEHQIQLINPKFSNYQLQIKYHQSLRGIIKQLEIMHGNQIQMFRHEFKVVVEMLEIIQQCLQDDPLKRPSLKQLYNRPVFKDIILIKDYLRVLKKAPKIWDLVSSISQPLINIFKNDNEEGDHNQEIKITELANKLSNYLQIQLQVQLIDQNYVIPKYYPINLNQKGQYSNRINQMKSQIRRNINFTIVNGLFKSKIMDILVYYQIKYNSDNIFTSLLKIFNKLTNLLKSYESTCSLYVRDIIELLIKIIYQNPHNLLISNPEWFHEFNISENHFIHRLCKILYYKTPSITTHIIKTTNLLKDMIYVTGQGNAHYQPVRDFLLQNADIANFMQCFYVSIRLIQNPTKQVFITTTNFYRDKVLQLIDYNILKVLKVQVSMLKLLKEEVSDVALLFFKELTQCIQIDKIVLFKGSIIYLNFVQILRSKTESMVKKSIVLQIATNLFEFGGKFYVERSACSSTNLLKQILRMMIEPPKDSVEHSIFVHLKPNIIKIGEYLDRSIKELQQYLEKIQGSYFIISSFKEKYILSEE